MKCIGLLGGMSWESTVSYYQALNRGVRERLGGLHSARVLLSSVDFAEIERLQHAGDWPATARLLAAEARAVQAGGADFLLIGTNTMHKVAPEIEAAIDIPLLHIADATARRLQADGVTRVGLLGTRSPWSRRFTRGGCRSGSGWRCWCLVTLRGSGCTASSMTSSASATFASRRRPSIWPSSPGWHRPAPRR